MNYELAKELKDAGFPQPRGNTDGEKIRGFWFTTAHQILLNVFDINDPSPVYEPTLSELIEACGATHPKYPDFEFCLVLAGNEWCAGYMDENMQTALPIAKGSIPEEAVARLYIALHPWQH